ncbi:hypothetical protein LOY35_18915 [Pseudomonas sp. B21-028]|uniref:hypothetical protein n=1 Tax=Pseudomonas sp. B21-028 TaxID=2895480 RepID=UPI0021602BD0|nr:hypothetical protein [Pseudomonas sp. B21-028]UVL82289.1 hypothetical protein LOY35_18915 [Pseudomonas sp. B21-028]
MAQYETEFHQLGDQLKSAFSERLNSLGKRGRLILYSDLYIPPSTFEFLIDFVRNKLRRYDTYTYKGCSLRFAELERSKETYASSIQSHFVLIYCPQHFSALRNAKNKLVEAGENMLAQLPCSDNYFRYLWVRVHSSTEIAILKEACDLMLKDHGHDYGFDAVVFLQPSVARDGSDSVINTYVTIAMAELHQGFNRAIVEGRAGQLIIDTPVGTLSNKPSELYLFNENGRMKIPEGNYVYQKADLYHLLRREGDEFVGNFSSPASGVRHHLVYKDASGEALFDAKFVEVDETLII